MKVIDVNVLVHAGNSRSPEHGRLLPWWEGALNSTETIGLCWSVIVAYARISTNASIYSKPLSMDEVLEKVDNWLSRRVVRLISERENHWSVLKTLLNMDRATGNLVNDAHLAALAISHGATLVSCDTDFARFRELRWENPLEAG